MKLGPRRRAALRAKRLPEGNHCGKEQQPHSFGCKADTTTIGTAGDPPVDDSEDSMPSLVDDSLEHRDGERPEVVPFELYDTMTERSFSPPYLSGTGSRVSRWLSCGALRGGAESD